MNYGAIAGTWDEDLDTVPSHSTPIIAPILERRQTDDSTATVTPSGRYPAHTPREETPLLHRATSLTFQKPSYTQLSTEPPPTTPRIRPLVRRGSQISTLSRISENGVSVKAKHLPGGQSTFGQTVSLILSTKDIFLKSLLFQLFNAIAILLGIGMLSEPLAFAYAGWIGGTLILISYGFVACYTYVHIWSRIKTSSLTPLPPEERFLPISSLMTPSYAPTLISGGRHLGQGLVLGSVLFFAWSFSPLGMYVSSSSSGTVSEGILVLL